MVYNEDGLENFGPQQIITTDIQGLVSVSVAVADIDGAAAVLSSTILDDTIAWYRTEIFSYLEDQILDKIFMYPNSSPNLITIQRANHKKINSVNCFDMQGNLLFISKK